MKKIKLSTYESNNETLYENIEFVVDKNFGRSGVTYQNCKFVFTTTGKLNLHSCHIKNCEFIGLDSNEHFVTNNGELKIENCTSFNGNSLKNTFDSIRLLQVKASNLSDFSNTNYCAYINTEISGFAIAGSCKDLTLQNCSFLPLKGIESMWNKIIEKEVTCMKVIFDDVKLNPFYLATKCFDKKSLDLSRATLIDDWSRLRKKYSGLSLFIVFLLTFIFFLPIITHSFLLIVLSNLEQNLLPIERVELWEALLYGGKTGWNAFFYCILTIILFSYNIGRIYMTVSISKLREEENFLKDSNFQLVSIHPNKIKNHIIINSILSFMFWISIIYTIIKLTDTLRILVPSFK